MFQNALDQPQMMVVNDLQDMFVPMVDGFLVTMDEADACLDSLLAEIPKMFADNRCTEVVLGPVVQAGIDALKVNFVYSGPWLVKKSHIFPPEGLRKKVFVEFFIYFLT